MTWYVYFLPFTENFEHLDMLADLLLISHSLPEQVPAKWCEAIAHCSFDLDFSNN